MLEKTIAAFDARRRFGKVWRDVEGKGDHYVVERHGEPVAAVVPMHLYEQWKRRREAFFDQMRAAGERAGMTEDEAMALALEATRAVRAEHGSGG